MKILVCNAGSSSLKFSLFEADEERLLANGSIDWTAHPAQLVFKSVGQPEFHETLSVSEHGDAVARLLANLLTGPSGPLKNIHEIEAVGHRVVHGGDRFAGAVQITAEVERAIAELSELAPLHNPAALRGIHVAGKTLPLVPQVAVFDTAFHSTLPAFARTYAIPRTWEKDWDIHRYGFHGLSHAYCASRAAEMLDESQSNLVIAHLGNGASVSAVRRGICVDTSMGFTPLEGLVMGTRSGSLDPGILLYLMRAKGLSAEQLEHALTCKSGLLGISGISSDMRDILKAAASNPDARLALEVYIHRLVKTIGAMTAALGGVDALVFTAGIGEKSAWVRELVCRNLGHLGLNIDCVANNRCKPDADIAQNGSASRILVISAREDLTILRETKRLVCPELRNGRQPAKQIPPLNPLKEKAVL